MSQIRYKCPNLSFGKIALILASLDARQEVNIFQLKEEILD